MKRILIFISLAVFVLTGCQKLVVSDLEPYSKLISIKGESIKFDDPKHPLHGLVIDLPDSAVILPIKLELVKKEFNPKYDYEFLSHDSVQYRIFQENQCFYIPIKITLPYDSKKYSSDKLSNLAVYYFDEDNQVFFPMIEDIDTINHLIKCITFHTGNFGVCLPLPIFKGSSINTNFQPSINGFRIINFGRIENTGLCDQYTKGDHNGHCAGISNFSLFYYLKRKSLGGFFTRYPNNDFEQQFRACRVQEWSFLLDGAHIFLPYINIENFLANNFTKDNPVILGCNWGLGKHAILACGIDDNNIYYCDPNFPGVMQTISIIELKQRLLVFSEKPLFPVLQQITSLCGQWDFTFSNAQAKNITISGTIPSFMQSFPLYTLEYQTTQLGIKIPKKSDYNEEFSGNAVNNIFDLKTETLWKVIDQYSNVTSGKGDTELKISFSGTKFDENCTGKLIFHIPQDFYGIFDWLVADASITFDVTGTRPWNPKDKSIQSSFIHSNSLTGNLESIKFHIK